MWLQFFAQNAHFAINLIAALACLGVCWLYLDAWLTKRSTKELAKWMGFGLLGISFVLQSTLIEQSVLGISLLGHRTTGLIVVVRLLAYAAILVGQLIDPLMEVPDNKGIKDPESKDTKKAFAVTGAVSTGAKALLPLGALGIAYLYYRRATTGLERHLKPLAYGFLALTVADGLHMFTLLRTTTNPILFSWVRSFGWIWSLEQLALLVGAVIIGRWVWGYLTKRFFSQLYMIFTLTTVTVFLLVSVCFTGLLLREIRSNSLVNLKTASHVLGYALEAKQSQTSSGAAQVAANGEIVTAVINNDRDKLASLTQNYLVDNKQTGLMITTADGQVLLRAEDTQQWGDSVSNDPLVRRALLGVEKSGISSVPGNSTMAVRSAVPLKDGNGKILGSVVASLDLGSAFVDGIKKSTGLQSALYTQNTLTASTFLNPDGKTRAKGSKLKDEAIVHTVLKNDSTYTGTTKLQGEQLLVSFLPIKDADDVVIGMTMVATPQSSILKTAGHSVELTFLLVAALILLSVFPIFLVSKSLVRQIK